MKELILLRAAQLTTERGSSFGEIASHIIDRTFLEDIRKATEWSKEAVRVMRTANDVTFVDDESAALFILKQLYAKHPGLKGRKSVVTL